MKAYTEVLADDLLDGAAPIARFVFGDDGKRNRVYYLVEKKQLPHFRLGNRICARKSALRAWIKEQESGSLGSDIGKQDRSIEAATLDRQQSDLGGARRRVAQIEKDPCFGASKSNEKNSGPRRRI